MNPGNGTVVSVMDVGGTHVTAASVDVETRSLRSGRSFREPLDGDGSAEEILSALVRCAARLPAQSATRWAVALPGPFDYERGIGWYEGVGKFDALRGFDLRAALTASLPDAARISFCNDADAFVLGEWWAGAARGHRSVVGITLGTGVGSCFLRDGRILRHGPGVPPEGRLHALRYAERPLEETVSRRALRRTYAQATGEAPPDVREMAQRARQGDRAAARVFAETFRALGRVLGPLLAAFEPTVLVVGGSIAGAWDLMAGPLRAGIAETDPVGTAGIVVTAVQHPAEAPLLGAAYLATAAVATTETHGSRRPTP
ncbi:ROK family protein [Streptomyces sp. NBC_01136]|uniref:ROK family protein n=1 Tax=unclassified Streptomyces TaxID=2593676 RepID=UPI00324911AC|nr:ROK family protein [Streptomyces sp. NBC_01136]